MSGEPRPLRTGAARAPVPVWTRLARFVRSPKGTLMPVLLALAAVGSIGGKHGALPVLLAGVGGAVATDLVFMHIRKGRVAFPSGAILTGLIIALVLARTSPPGVPVAVAAIAVASKHLLRTRWGNIFNPATFAIILYSLFFHSAQSWWGAVPFTRVAGFPLLALAAWYIARKVNRVLLATSFLAVILTVVTVAAFLGDAQATAQVFRLPDINALVFFAGFILTDPPTSPAKPADQVWFGALVGLLGAVTFLRFGVQWFILAGLPVANAAESLRRVIAGRRARRPKPDARTVAPRIAAAPPVPVAPAVPGVPAARPGDRQVWRRGPQSGQGGLRHRHRAPASTAGRPTGQRAVGGGGGPASGDGPRTPPRACGSRPVTRPPHAVAGSVPTVARRP